MSDVLHLLFVQKRACFISLCFLASNTSCIIILNKFDAWTQFVQRIVSIKNVKSEEDELKPEDLIKKVSYQIPHYSLIIKIKNWILLWMF